MREDIIQNRVEKISLLRAAGVDPYPAKTHRTHTIVQIRKTFTTLQDSQEIVTIAGRIRVLRNQGNITFIKIQDGTGIFQVVLIKSDMNADLYKLFIKTIDIGDFIEVSGTCFITKAGQESIKVSNWHILTKSLRPLPTEYFGMKDEEERFRKRYLDILLNPDVRAMLERKSIFWATIRHFLTKKGFLEVETPTLEVTTGGAEARPFITHHNDFDINVYLRICIGELWQKRLIAAGFEKTFEIGRAYRNEGSSPEHLQEFTNIEFYWAYADYRDGMALVQELYRTIAKEVYGTTKFVTRGHVFDLANEWKEIDYQEEIMRQTGIDVLVSTKKQIQKKLKELGVKYTGVSRERLTDSLWKYCRKNITGPAFLVGVPQLVSPLAKTDPIRPSITQRFQPLLAGAEVGNGYSELNDPIEQRKRFNEQKKLLAEGDCEAMMPEWDFVEMLEYGMPPTCGFGFGERLFAFFENKTLRECQTFPLMKPKIRKQS